MTSSPGPMPAARSARCTAAVPLAHDTANFVSQNWAKSFSKRSTYLPDDEIQVESMQSSTYSRSFPDSDGVVTGKDWAPFKSLTAVSVSTVSPTSASGDTESSGFFTVSRDQVRFAATWS